MKLFTCSILLQEIPREELEADDSDKVIGVFHFSKDLTRTHGVPFKFVVKRVCDFLIFYLCIPTLPIDRERNFPKRRSVYKPDQASPTKILLSIVLPSSRCQRLNSPHTSKMVCTTFCDKTSEMPISHLEDTIYEHQFAPEDVLGLDHVDRSGKGRSGPSEKAIVIRG